MTKPLAIGFLCFCVTLAILIGQRLSDQAMAVIVGSVIGVVSSMPMAALILWMLIRQREAGSYAGASARRDYAANDQAPRMIVIQPQPYRAGPSQVQMMNESSVGNTAGLEPAAFWDVASRRANWRQMRPARDFTIIGEEEFEDEDRNALV